MERFNGKDVSRSRNRTSLTVAAAPEDRTTRQDAWTAGGGKENRRKKANLRKRVRLKDGPNAASCFYQPDGSARCDGVENRDGERDRCPARARAATCVYHERSTAAIKVRVAVALEDGKPKWKEPKKRNATRLEGRLDISPQFYSSSCGFERASARRRKDSTKGQGEPSSGSTGRGGLRPAVCERQRQVQTGGGKNQEGKAIKTELLGISWLAPT